jgi:type IV pilus assembly protein PilW
MSASGRQGGFTLIELSVAVLIGLFLLGGLLTIVQQNRRVFGNQGQLAQLQENQRLAMTIMANVIHVAGYFPDPTSNTSASSMTANGTFAAAGQAIVGTENAAVPGDTISVRYATATGDGILNCSGTSNATGANQVYVNAFSVVINPVGSSPGSWLTCTMNGTSYPLVRDVQNLSILYGVKTNFAVDNNSIDIYLNAAQMTAANWNNVLSVKVTLSFLNPLYVGPGLGQPQTIAFERVIGVMNRFGVRI